MFLFSPFIQQRTWGERHLETLFHRTLPADGLPYGESWEISDRPEANSPVLPTPAATASGIASLTLHDLWTSRREELFGAGYGDLPAFPLLCKILDCHDVLSLQVHPPAHVAPQFGGEPKTEIWYVAGTTRPDASLYAGLDKPLSPEEIRSSILDGSFTGHVTQMQPQVGDSIFIPSGCPHAIGAGLVIFEIQQNSDTTYRVHDWDRLDRVTGKPRELHIEESIASIWPEVSSPELRRSAPGVLADCPEFHIERVDLAPGETLGLADPGHFAIFVVASGNAILPDATPAPAGSFILVPAHAPAPLAAAADSPASILRVTVPANRA